MTYEIKASQIHNRAEFEVAVATHITRMTAFNKEVGQPRPVAHPLVEASIKRVQTRGRPDAYVPDYTIVEDTPPPAPAISLDDKKRMHQAALAAAESEAKFKLLPQRKMRLAQLKYQAAMRKPEDERTPEENEDVASLNLLEKAFAAITLKGAQAESDIDDLTDDTVDNWQLPKLD